MKKRFLLFLIAAALLFSACGESTTLSVVSSEATAIPSPSPTPLPTGANDMDYSFLWQDSEYTGSYTGRLENLLPTDGNFSGENAQGDTLYFSGTWTDGTPDSGDIIAERALAFWDGGLRRGTYKGSLLSGLFDGEGHFTAQDSTGLTFTYEGEWVAGAMNGQGTLTYDSELYGVRTGLFTEGAFTPTALEALQVFGCSEPRFTLSDEQLAYLSDFPEIWEEDYDHLHYFDSPMLEHYDRKLTMAKVYETPEELPLCWMVHNGFRIMAYAITALYEGGPEVTVFTVVTDGNYDKVVEIIVPTALECPIRRGARLHAIGVPIAMSTYTSVISEELPCMVFLAADVFIGS